MWEPNMKKLILILLSVGLSVQAWAARVFQPEDKPYDNTIVEIYARLKVPQADGLNCIEGTGWFINKKELITAYHVVKNADLIEIDYADGLKRRATIHRWNEACDLASLVVDDPRTDQNYLGIIDDSEKIGLNDRITSVGYPNEHRTAVSGTIDRLFHVTSPQTAVFATSDMPLDVGASGSPVLHNGEVIGVATSVTIDPKNYQAWFVSANELWEALGITSSAHPKGFNTGVSQGLDIPWLQTHSAGLHMSPSPALAPSPALQPTAANPASPLLNLLALAIGLGFWLLPGLIANKRHHANRGGIWALNILFGWNGIGWIIALVWALSRPSAKPS
jgi:hypothetical protein